MSNTRYNVDYLDTEEISAKLLYISASKYGGDWRSFKHTHWFSEFFYVLSGMGSFIVGNKTFSVKQDDLVIVNPHVEHTEFSLSESPLEYIVLGVDGLTFNFSSEDNNTNSHSVFNYKNDRVQLLFYLNALINEVNSKDKNYAIVCQNLLEVLIIKLQRITNYCFSIVPMQKSSKECNIIKQYIDSNFYENITLEFLAKLTHLNKFYLVHAFSKYYGLSPINYLIERRIMHSKDLLTSTNHSISQIALATGFSSQSYFSQCFKHMTGLSPNKYRKIVEQQKI